MLAIDLLTHRQSNAFLQAPAPSKEHLALIFKAGMRAPDHGGLTPWHYTVVVNQGLQKLSDIFVSTLDEDVAESKKEKVKNMPFRAPLIIVVSTRVVAHNKVPTQEQLIAAGCSAHAMQMAAYTLGYGAIWRTGELSYHPEVKKQLAIDTQNEIVGFLYIGSKSKELPVKANKAADAFIDYL